MTSEHRDNAIWTNLDQDALNSSPGGPIKFGYLKHGPLPLVIEASIGGVNLAAWAEPSRSFIEQQLLEHGAVLFRGFCVRSAPEFEQFIKAVSGEAMKYQERSSPRSEVGGNVYTSTDYPPRQSIFPHNEHSYSRTFPARISFFCLKPAQQGGETPIADCRKILKRIATETVDKFIEKKWMYLRNYGDGYGLPWQTVFQTTDRGVVEEYCRKNLIEFEWKDQNRLRTWQVRPAVIRHPRTGELVWFNHATFFHVTTLDSRIRNALSSLFKEEDLPNNTYYGDHEPIEQSVLDQLRNAYLQETVSFTWQQGDVLMLDNMLTAHSRKPYSGPRKILVAMAEPYTRDDL
jgi:alpha-ketoglutarate-dependent taurine dioxygenase